MKVRVEYAVVVNDDIRRAIRMHYGRDGLATREEVKEWYRSFGESMDDDLSYAREEEAKAQEMYARAREEFPEDRDDG